MNHWLLIILGLILLVGGAETLIRGAVGLATRFSISPLIIGATIVAFGTSAPEVAVSLSAVHDGTPQIAIGNAVGSNTFNILFILGLTALISPLVVARRLIRIDIPIMIGVSILLWGFALDGRLGRVEGAILLAGIAAYTIAAIRVSRRESRLAAEQAANDPGVKVRLALPLAIGLTIGGLVVLVLGARWFVSGSVSVATALGLSELIIGLTIVAVGTSLPEVATSIVAAVRGQRDLAIANVVGSNIFNILGILGISSLAAPSGLPVPGAAMAFDIPVMAAVAITCLPIAFTGQRINRWEGLLLLGGYAAYVAYLLLLATEHDAISGFSSVMLAFVIPLAALGVIVSVVNAARRRAGSSA